MPHEPNRALARQKLEALAWQKTPADYRGSSGIRREVLLNTTEGATLVPLGEMTDYQLRRYIGPSALEEAGDMRKNGEGQAPELAFIEEVKSRLNVGDRQVRFSVGGGTPGTPYYTGQMFVSLYNVPTGIGGAAAENNRLMLQVTGFKGEREPEKLKVELSVRGPSFDDARFRLRAKTATPSKIADYIADFLNMAAKKAPYGHDFDNYDKNPSREQRARAAHYVDRGDPVFVIGDAVERKDGAGSGQVIDISTKRGALEYLVKLRDGNQLWFDESELVVPAHWKNPSRRREEADETAARELSLYIENEYSLVGAPNSQGKAIEKNLLGHLRRGNFDIKKAEIAYMHLMETGAKKYCKEFAEERDWHKIFSVPTRELVAHEFATTFAEEHGIKTLAPNVFLGQDNAEDEGEESDSGIEIEEFAAPAHWASAFINGDTSGLEEEDLAEFEAWCAKHPSLDVVDVSEEAHIGRWNGLQTELATYIAHVREGS